MANVQLRGVKKIFGNQEVIKGVNLDIADREFIVFVGPSGCGKSTLLRMIAGLEDVSTGDLLIDGVRVNDVPPDSRGLAMVFQSYALYPHMTVAANMGFALRLAKVPKAEREAKVLAAARILQLEPLLERKPGQLSGGQRQRVAIGRAIVRQPKVFLFDEPLSNLDASLRVQMRLELARLHRELATTMIYVTHDQVEAMTMADRIVVLQAGRIEQVGTPLDLYQYPANLFVAGFIGSPKMNLAPVRVVNLSPKGVTVSLPGGQSTILPFSPQFLQTGALVTLGLRPEHLNVAADGPLKGEVAVVEHLGGETLAYVDVGDSVLLTVKLPGDSAVFVGEKLALVMKNSETNLFDSSDKAIPGLEQKGP
jgi:multiple sugar transport system ATP-binding protein